MESPNKILYQDNNKQNNYLEKFYNRNSINFSEIKKTTNVISVLKEGNTIKEEERLYYNNSYLSSDEEENTRTPSGLEERNNIATNIVALDAPKPDEKPQEVYINKYELFASWVSIIILMFSIRFEYFTD